MLFPVFFDLPKWHTPLLRWGEIRERILTGPALPVLGTAFGGRMNKMKENKRDVFLMIDRIKSVERERHDRIANQAGHDKKFPRQTQRRKGNNLDRISGY